ncbi:tyrosine-protein kinase domain-containing protein [Thalassiella azotivora]
MEISQYLRVLRERWRFVALLTLLSLGGAAAASLLSTPVYRASTQLFVAAQASGSAADLLQGSNFTQQRVTSYRDVVTSTRVLAPVIDELDLDVTTDELARVVTATTPPDSVLITVTVADESPEDAARVANAVGASFTAVVAELEQPSAEGGSPVRISTIEPATAPERPASPNVPRNLGLGLVLGLVLGVGAALLRETLDTSVVDEDDVSALTEASVLGGIAFDPDVPKRPLVVQGDPGEIRSEAFRQIRTNLQFIDAADHPRAIVVTSSIPGEGKTSTAVNLAITMAAAGSRICLVEGDLRRPKVSDYMGMERAAGLTTVLIGQADLADVLQPWGDGNLQVLAAGQLPPNPSELLGSAAMERLIGQLTASFDVVLIDAPPLLPVTDAAVLSKLADGALLIVGSQRIHRDQLTRALSHLENVDARLLGVVLNLLPAKRRAAGYYYGYAGEYRSSTPAVDGAGTPGRHLADRLGLSGSRDRG